MHFVRSPVHWRPHFFDPYPYSLVMTHCTFLNPSDIVITYHRINYSRCSTYLPLLTSTGVNDLIAVIVHITWLCESNNGFIYKIFRIKAALWLLDDTSPL